MKRKLGVFMMILTSIFLLAACGSDGGDSTPAIESSQGSNNWDEMVWNQDDWG